MELFQQIDEQVLTALRNGDESAFRTVYVAYTNYLRRYAFKIVKSDAAAEEIVQTVMIKVWLHRTVIDPGRSFEGWLRTITRNATFDYLKEIGRNRVLQDRIREDIQYLSGQHADAPLQEKEFMELYDAAIRLLPPQQQKVFHLSRDLDMSHAEIAHQLSISSNTVRNHMVAALGYLRRYFKTNMGLCIIFFIIFFDRH